MSRRRAECCFPGIECGGVAADRGVWQWVGGVRERLDRGFGDEERQRQEQAVFCRPWRCLWWEVVCRCDAVEH